MSSTNRGATKMAFDYYRTPEKEIIKFLKAFQEDIGIERMPKEILDPCAGGNRSEALWQYKPEPEEPMKVPPSPMAYPSAIAAYTQNYEPMWNPRVYTMDIREDSPAEAHGDFLAVKQEPGQTLADAIISNPPFSLAMQFIQHSLTLVKPGGYVIMLLRANYFGSEARHKWFQANMPVGIYFHSNRMSFTPDGKKDSVEYVHAVWQRGATHHVSNFRILDY